MRARLSGLSATTLSTIAIVACSLAMPAGVSAQQCDLINPGGADVAANNVGTATQTAIITNGSLRCGTGANAKYLSATQMGTSAVTDVVTMYGNVMYRDADKIVTADNGQWMKRQALFQARGNVVVTDAKTGSRLSAPSLDYYQVSASNRVSRVATFGGRARVVMRQAKSTPIAPGARRDTSVVDADIIEIIGERLFKGTGNAVLTRADVRGSANIIEYNQDTGGMLLAQNARIDGEQYDLTADTVTAVASDGQQLSEVRASRDAKLVTDEVRVESPFLRIYLDSGSVNRLVATRPLSQPGQPVSLPRVLSTSFNVSADSIDALAPNQKLEQVNAIGHAFGERLDTVPPPAAAKDLPDILTNDWLRGDTLRASFIEDPASQPDSAGRRERMLDRIVAVGSGEAEPASSALRMKQPRDADGWRIYYTLASRITVAFSKGAVLKVDLENGRGVFLTPTAPVSGVGTRAGGS